MHAADESGGSESSWKDSYKTAQMISLPDVTSVCGEQAGQLVRDLAQGVGCPEEFVLLPLLSCCSALMGHRSEIRVHSAWSEPPVLWVMVGAGVGTRRSAALRQVLMPLLSLREEGRRLQGDLPRIDEDEGNGGLHFPTVVTGIISMQQLQEVLHEAEGDVLHISESIEDCHRVLDMHAMQRERGDIKTARDKVCNLYEGFPGHLGIPIPSSDNKKTSYSTLSQPVAYNQCGFASPEYLVNLTVKAPHWLSGRFLVSCPRIEENSFVRFSIPEGHASEGDDSSSSESPRTKKAKRVRRLKLRDVYHNLACAHSQTSPRQYVFTKDAVQELQRFQQEEWSTIVNQLGVEDNGGVMGKSLGQIVRLTGVLKALSEASKPDLDNGLSFNSEINTSQDSKVEVDSADVKRAVELGKYFLEQKLSMTFMVSTGFFRNAGTPRQSQDVSAPSAPQTNGMSYMPPPPSQLNAMYGFPKMNPMTAPGTEPGRGGVTVSSPQPSHLPQNMPMTSLAAAHNAPPFPFNMLAGGPLPGFPMMGPRGNPHLPPPPTSNSSSLPIGTPAEIDVSTLPATWIPTSPEEEMAELSQAAEFAQLEPSQFVAVHARRVKRLLECFDDGCGVSATTAAQKSIAPPVKIAGTNNRHPAWASALFFQKVADLGLGIAEQVRHPTNGRIYWRFKRKPVAELTEKNIQLLEYLRIDMMRYSRLGQPTLNVSGLDLEAVMAGSGSERSVDDDESEGGDKGRNSAEPVMVGDVEIKREML